MGVGFAHCSGSSAVGEVGPIFYLSGVSNDTIERIADRFNIQSIDLILDHSARYLRFGLSMARTAPQSAIRNPLNYVFGVDSNVRVLRALSRHGGFLSSSDIGRRARLSKSSTRLGLISLVETGVVSVEGSGYNRLYRFNSGHYLSGTIECLFAAEALRFKEILDAVSSSPGETKRSLKSLWIYGSFALGADGLGSDLDVGIIADVVDLSVIVEAVRVSLDANSEALGFSPSVVGLDLDDVRRLVQNDDPWWSSMLKDAIVLAGRRPDELLPNGI